MALTQGEKLLISTLMNFPLDEKTQESIFLFLETNEQQYVMMEFLVTHPKATEQEILAHLRNILIQTKKSESLSED